MTILYTCLLQLNVSIIQIIIYILFHFIRPFWLYFYSPVEYMCSTQYAG